MMKHNDKIRQQYKDETGTLIMTTDFSGIPFSTEYVLWLEDKLNILILPVVIESGCPHCGHNLTDHEICKRKCFDCGLEL